MKPLNSNTKGCNPVSSNCVVWNGPEIPCINLCKGDSIDAVTAKLGLQLCEVLAQINVAKLDMSKLGLSKNPEDLNELLQALINHTTVVDTTSTGASLQVGSEVTMTDAEVTSFINNGGTLKFI